MGEIENPLLRKRGVEKEWKREFLVIRGS